MGGKFALATWSWLCAQRRRHYGHDSPLTRWRVLRTLHLTGHASGHGTDLIRRTCDLIPPVPRVVDGGSRASAPREAACVWRLCWPCLSSSMVGSRPAAIGEDVEFWAAHFEPACVGLSDPRYIPSSHLLKDLRRSRGGDRLASRRLSAVGHRNRCTLNHFDTFRSPQPVSEAKVSSTTVTPAASVSGVCASACAHASIAANCPSYIHTSRNASRCDVTAFATESRARISRMNVMRSCYATGMNAGDAWSGLVALLVRGSNSKCSNTPPRQPCVSKSAWHSRPRTKYALSDIHHCESVYSLIFVRNVLQPRPIVMEVVVEKLSAPTPK